MFIYTTFYIESHKNTKKNNSWYKSHPAYQITMSKIHFPKLDIHSNQHFPLIFMTRLRRPQISFFFHIYIYIYIYIYKKKASQGTAIRPPPPLNPICFLRGHFKAGYTSSPGFGSKEERKKEERKEERENRKKEEGNEVRKEEMQVGRKTRCSTRTPQRYPPWNSWDNSSEWPQTI